MAKEYPIVDSVESFEAALARVRAAQKVYATYTQEQVDKIFKAAALAANNMRIPLAKMAVEETGMGVVEDKVIKNHYAAEYIYNAYKDTQTVGVLERDEAFGMMKVAEPIGVVAAVIPTTNPTSTAIFKTLICLKTRNGIIISPHPRAKKSTIAAAKVVLEAAVAAGAPEDIISWVDVPSLELTNMAMKEADIILATGGPGMVKAAYSSGKPALGVGAGNTPAIIDESADVKVAVNSILHSKTFDNGMICASEQSTIVLDSIYDAVKAEFAKRGAYFLEGEELDKVRKTIIINGALNAKIVGQKAHTIAKLAGVDVPETAKVLIGEVESVDISEEFAHEKLSPVLAMYRAKDIDDAFDKAEHLIADGGYGHTSSIYLNAVTRKDLIDRFAARMKTCRILVNTPSSQGGIGDLYNFMLRPSLTLGCGSWGGNSVSENVGVKHLLNVKTVAIRRENMLWFRAPEKVYLKKGCLPVALNELKAVMGKKRCFIVTDAFLFKSGFTKAITDKLDELGIGKIASVSGRYYAMDRDNNWDREEKAYAAFVYGEGNHAANAQEAIEASYADDKTDEFVLPCVTCEGGRVQDGDTVIFMNFRPDRARQMTRIFCDDAFTGFERRGGRKQVHYVCMAEYDATMPNCEVAYPPVELKNVLGQYLSENGKTQLRIAETEKYAHVTFFFNGGVEAPYEGEDRCVIPSPKVATYDLKPEMSAPEVAAECVKRIESGKYDVVILNFANCDMVGHTGVFDAAVKAVEAVDTAVDQVVSAVLKAGGCAFITADHGNAEKMMNPDGTPFTAHTTNVVPFVAVGCGDVKLREGGCLADIAPTMLPYIGLPVPADMTGKSTIVE